MSEIDNPCYHCYTGATGQCYMTKCKYQFEKWGKNVESMTVEVNASDKMLVIENNS